ncbi:MAG: fumarylacetoacetate hydrolase family protein [Oleiphilaceae bacterium]|nr:fumarylacetoacetate hydrolase family protein [Oleiphilaceae bacterium]
MYQPVWFDGKEFDARCSKLVCIGRNYAEHAKELNNPIPKAPILFIKPESTIQTSEQVVIPREGIHYEAELTVLIGRDINVGAPVDVSQDIAGLGLGLDLTDRGLQAKLKEKGHPWERAKSFDGASVLTSFIPFSDQDLSQINFQLLINDEVVQDGVTSDMLFDIPALIQEVTSVFSLRKGDILFTGTPKGVGVLKNNDRLNLSLKAGEQQIDFPQYNVVLCDRLAGDR